jgi:hypothetical protein
VYLRRSRSLAAPAALSPNTINPFRAARIRQLGSHQEAHRVPTTAEDDSLPLIKVAAARRSTQIQQSTELASIGILVKAAVLESLPLTLGVAAKGSRVLYLSLGNFIRRRSEL